MNSYLIQPNLKADPASEVYDTSSIPFSFPLDPFQKHAVSAIQQEHNVLVCAKTGSGKTLVGEYQIHHSMKKHMRVFYTTPIKSLSNQKFYDLKQQYPDVSVGIMTGDIKFCPDAQIVIMTTEILRNLLYKKGTQTEHLGLTASLSLENLDAVIFDECHYINDADRGKVWEETMILLPRDVKLIMLSATLDHPELFAGWIGALKERHIHLIQTSYRIVPLTHTVLSNNTLQTIMCEKEIFYDKTYSDWIRARKQVYQDHEAYQRKVHAAKMGGQEGPIDGKVRPKDFVCQLNDTIGLMERQKQLPALFFVLSRKHCEEYANKVTHTLLTTSEIASVSHIIGFHLSRYKSQLDILPQFHRISDLLKRGIAFHHSGLLPLLKEIVEILFARGLVKVLFATETFAVGLNMPTKTVVFTGLKKYDDNTGGMRLLRTDEYIQMAGRAGRRGKDTEGLVLYLPDREPVATDEMKQIMKGGRPPIQSRMDFHYDFLLKTLQTGELKWLTIMEESYWFRQRAATIEQITREVGEISSKIAAISKQVPGEQMKEVATREQIELSLRQSVNAKKKECQRLLNQWNDRHVGPKWVLAIKLYSDYNKLLSELAEREGELLRLKSHAADISPIMRFLQKAGFLSEECEVPEELGRGHLTLRGILATEINEGHPIILTDLFLSERAHNLSAEDLVSLLACFLEYDSKSDENAVTFATLNASRDVKDVIEYLDVAAQKFMEIEDKVALHASPDDYWRLSVQMIEPIRKWIDGENIAIICQEYGIFEGNFTRAILKLGNLLDEWLSLATFCEHTSQIEKVIEIKRVLIRDIVVPDSLYLRL